MGKSEQGFTVNELLIAVAILSVVLAGAYNTFLASSQRLVLQHQVVEMQTDARAAMNFIVQELRLAFGTPVITTTVTPNDTITFDRLEDAGYSSGGNTITTLNDTRKTWSSNSFDPYYTVTIIAGTGAGQARSISGNSSTQLTVVSAWETPPDSSSFYVITRKKAFTRTSTTDKVLRYTAGGSINQPLADLITSHTFALPDANTISITLTAQTKNVDPNTHQKRQYTLTETVQKRNH
jgi:prepilin-type N-terminal cleavage/methylation domain-containing protein